MIRKILILTIKIYRLFLSPLLGKKCRFIPSCSKYYIDALEKYKLLRGTKLFLLRLIKCHPFFSGNIYDPIDKASSEE